MLVLALGLATTFTACRKSKDKDKDPESIKVGALLSLTGNWSSLGLTSKAAIELALEDVNEYLESTGSDIRFSADIYDTKLEPTLATQYIAEAKAAGHLFVLGPQSSAEVAAIKEYADTADVLVVSQSSTAGSLSVAGDNIFRFCPDDKLEGAAMAKTIFADGVRGLITIARDDAGNRGLQTAVGESFTTLSGAVDALTPYATTVTDFSTVLAELKTKVHNSIAMHGLAGTAVYLACFDEGADLFAQAGTDSVLRSVRWYGSDGVALSAAFLSNAAAADFAMATSWFAPTFGLPDEAAPKWQPVAQRIKDRSGLEPDAFALATYDAVWVIARTYQASSKHDATNMKSQFREQAGMYYGVTGSTLLNNAGDRALGSFDYWGISNSDGEYKWVLVGKSE